MAFPIKNIYIVLLTTAVAFALLGYAYFIEPRRLVINSSEVVVTGLEPAFDGLKIVAVSDIHGGSNGIDHEKLREIVRQINRQQPDAVVMLGDYVANTSDRKSILMPVSEIADGLSGIESKFGVFVVLGNHDGWHSDQTIASSLSNIGYIVLQNEIAVIERGGKKLNILGLKDHLRLDSWYTFDAMVRGVSQPYANGDFIVLEHSPDVFHVLNYHKSLGDRFRLMIAGHSHGGQVWLPIVGSPLVPSSFGQKYVSGHIKEDGRHLFVTTGIGTSIMPFRFLVPPEIAVLTLRAPRKP